MQFYNFFFSAEISIVICDKEERSIALMNDKNEMPTLKLIVQVEPISEDAKKKAKEVDLELLSFKDLEVSFFQMVLFGSR